MDLTHQPEPAEEVEPSEAFQALWDWALSQGVTCPKLKYPVKFGSGYLGAQAKERIGPLEPMVSVPRRLMLNIRSAEESDIAQVYEAHPEVYTDTDLEIEDLKLITYLLAELKKGKDSFWYYLLQSLDHNVEVLCDWTAEELALLQEPEMIRESDWKLEYIRTNYSRLLPILERYPEHFLPELNDFDHFYWLWKTLSTRAFGKYNPSCSLVPLADLVNHAYCHSYYIIGEPDESVGGAPDTCVLDTTYQDPEVFPAPPKFADLLPVTKAAWDLSEESFLKLTEIEKEIQAALNKEEEEEVWGGPWDVEEDAQPVFSIRCGNKEEYEAGSQLTLFYGHYSNRQLLLHYGFALEENMYNYARVTIPLQDMAEDQRLGNLLLASGLDKKYFFSVRQYEVCTALLLKLRALNWDPRQHAPDAYFYPRDWNLEVHILAKAINLLDKELQKFPTTLEQDAEELKQQSSLRGHFAVRCITDRLSHGAEEVVEGTVRAARDTAGSAETCDVGWEECCGSAGNYTAGRDFRKWKRLNPQSPIEVPSTSSHSRVARNHRSQATVSIVIPDHQMKYLTGPRDRRGGP